MATYEIIIKNQTTEEDDNNLAGQEQNQEEKKDKNTAQPSSQIKNIMRYVALNSTRELVVSKVGELTRNNLLQRKIDAGIGIAQTAVAFAINPYLGAVTLATQVASQMIDYNVNVTKQSARLEVMGERAGYINRSRD